MRRTVWHHPNAYYHVNREPGDDNGESISAIQIVGLRRRAAETRRLEENQGEGRGRFFSYVIDRSEQLILARFNIDNSWGDTYPCRIAGAS